MKIAFRADSGRRLSRCLALAGAMKETDASVEAVFLSSCTKDEAALISASGAAHVPMDALGAWDAEETAAQLEACAAVMAVIDSPHADEGYLSSVRGKAFTALFDERAALEKYDVDVVVNPSVNAHMLGYPQDCEAELMLGTDFAIIPQSFDAYQDQPRSVPERAKRLAVCFGDDPQGLSIRAVRALKSLKGQEGAFTALVATGPGFRKGEQLASEIGLDPRFNAMTDAEPARRLHGADMAVSEAGFLPEILFFSLPSILACAPGDGEAEYAARSGLARCLPSMDERTLAAEAAALMGSEDERKRMCMRMNELVDGLGRYRLAEELLRAWRADSESL